MPGKWDSDPPERRRPLPPEFEAFRRLADELIERKRREYEESLRRKGAGAARRPAAAAGAATLDRRLRRWFTLPHLSYALNALVLVGLLLGFSFRSYLFPEDRIPVRVSDTVVTVLTPDERDVIWSHDFGYIVRQAEVAPWGRHKRYLVVAAGDSQQSPASLTVWDFRDRHPGAEPVWSHAVEDRELDSYYPDSMRQGTRMWCNGFAFADLEGGGEPELVASFHDQEYLPSCLRTLDRDGHVLGTYYNWGYFDGVTAADVDADGRDEILGYGTNNAYQGATVVMLDRDHLSGHAVDDVTRPDSGFREGALARLVLPAWDTELTDYFEFPRTHTADLLWLPYEKEPVLKLKVGRGFIAPWEKRVGIDRPVHYVIVRLDPQLRPLGVIPHDNVAVPVRQAFEEGRLSKDMSSTAFWEEWLQGCRRFGAMVESETS